MRVLLRFLVAICILPSMLMPQQPATWRALIIGNGKYKPLPPVAAFPASADLLDKQLRGLGFKTEFKQDLDQGSMVKTTNDFAGSISAGDVVFFYFCGYGMQDDGTNYLLPTDYDPQAPTELSGKAYEVDFLLRKLAERKTGLSVIVLDAAWEWQGLSRANQGLASVAPPERTLVSFPVQAGKVLKPPSGNSPSAFARALGEAIDTAGLKLPEVFDRVATNVNKSDPAQRPYSSQSAVGDFVFIKAEEKAPEVVYVDKYVDKPLKAGDTRENPKDLLNYVWIPAGAFQMGCVDADPKCRPDEKPRHEVTLSHSFWISSSEVTLSAYDRFLKANSSHRKPRRTQTNYRGKSTELPSTNVTWDDAQDYCKWAGGLLPTEAEWEYAARGGKPGEIYPWGDTDDPTQANYKSKTAYDPTPVRSFPENGWHLFDMAGNVAEWVQDVYDPEAYKKPGPFVDPLETAGAGHVYRGGSYYDPIEYLRNSSRDHPTTTSKYGANTVGFRCVLPKLEAR